MAIADTIQSMYTHVGDVYDTITNVDLPTNKNIQNIPSTMRSSYLEIMNNGIDKIWNNWEKVEGTGESLSLNNTEEAPMKINLKGNTSQEGTPTPEAPQDIHVVSGNNTIEVVGKNIFDKSKALLNRGVAVATGNLYNSDINFSTNYIEVKTNGTYYTTSGVSSVANRVYGAQYDSNKQYVGAISTNVGEKTFYISNSNTKYIRLTGLLEEIDTYQVEEGSSASEFQPYQSASYPINLGVENLCNVSNTITTSAFGMNVTLNEDVVTCSGTPTRQYINTEAVNLINPLKAGNTYNFVAFSDNLPSGLNFRIWGYNSDNVLKFNVKSGSSLAITEDIIKYRLVLEGMTTGTSYNIQAKLQIEKGDKFNSYTPYGMEPIKMCNIDTYKDSFLRTSGKNLFDDTYNDLGMWITNIGATTTFAQGSQYLGAYCKVEPGTYTISRNKKTNRFRIGVSPVQPTDTTSSCYVVASNDNASSITIDVPQGNNYICVYLSNNSETSTDVNLMIEKGSSATSYEPYGSGDWYLQQSIGEVVFTNATNWYYDVRNTRFSTQVTGSRTEGSRFPIVSNYFSYASSGGGNGVGFNYGGSIWLYKYDCTSVSEFQTWLGEHNTDVYYILATPTYTKITYEPLLEQLEALYNAKSKNSQTNITQENNDLPFILDTTALKELTQ